MLLYNKNTKALVRSDVFRLSPETLTDTVGQAVVNTAGQVAHTAAGIQFVKTDNAYLQVTKAPMVVGDWEIEVEWTPKESAAGTWFGNLLFGRHWYGNPAGPEVMSGDYQGQNLYFWQSMTAEAPLPMPFTYGDRWHLSVRCIGPSITMTLTNRTTGVVSVRSGARTNLVWKDNMFFVGKNPEYRGSSGINLYESSKWTFDLHSLTIYRFD